MTYHLTLEHKRVALARLPHGADLTFKANLTGYTVEQWLEDRVSRVHGRRSV